MADIQADRNGDQRREGDREPRDHEVLEEPVRDPGRAGPGRRIREEGDEVVHQRTPARACAHGDTNRSNRTNRKSAANARITESAAPSRYWVGKKLWRPSVISWPSPPKEFPRTAAIV